MIQPNVISFGDCFTDKIKKYFEYRYIHLYKNLYMYTCICTYTHIYIYTHIFIFM